MHLDYKNDIIFILGKLDIQYSSTISMVGKKEKHFSHLGRICLLHKLMQWSFSLFQSGSESSLALTTFIPSFRALFQLFDNWLILPDGKKVCTTTNLTIANTQNYFSMAYTFFSASRCCFVPPSASHLLKILATNPVCCGGHADMELLNASAIVDQNRASKYGVTMWAAHIFIL